VIKLNSDGAIREEQGVVSGGGVARDANGFRGAWCHVYHGISDPLCIKALAFRDAVLFASQQGYNRIVCEKDCEVLVKLWKGRRNHRSMIAPVFREIDDIISAFESFDFYFAGRSTNRVAHECDKFACEMGLDTVWLEDSPGFLTHNLQADCNCVLLS
jgi:hypothetical protein